MKINFNPLEFFVNDKGEIEYHGKVITIHDEFRYMSKEQKLDILQLLVNWANDEIDKIKKAGI